MQRTARLARVRGVVQGVAFRWSTRRRAEKLGLAGWVRNLPDGSVEAWVEGAEGEVGELCDWLRRGPPGARVESLELEEHPPEGHGGFEIRK